MSATLYIFPLKKELKVFIKNLKVNNINVNEVKTNYGTYYMSYMSENLKKPVETRQKNYFCSAAPGELKFSQKLTVLLKHLKAIHSCVLLGTAGALTQKINIGDILLVESVIEINAHLQTLNHFSLTKIQSQHATHNYKVHLGSVCSSEQCLRDENLRENIYRETKALALTMESSAAVKLCQEFGIPCSEIRVITDHCNSTTEFDFTNNFDLALRNLADYFATSARH